MKKKYIKSSQLDLLVCCGYSITYTPGCIIRPTDLGAARGRRPVTRLNCHCLKNYIVEGSKIKPKATTLQREGE